MLVSLFTVRVVLESLGVEDYGIYNVVGGIVTFFVFLSGTMASATQRFFSFSLGQGDQDRLNKMFTVNWLIYGGIALIAMLLLETVGLWFVYNHLNVPETRFTAVLWVYQFSILTFLMSIIASPFMALIIAHEEMKIYAYVSILEAILKLLVVFLLTLLPFDKLEIYGVLLFLVSLLINGVYIGICISRYEECQFKKFYWDKGIFKDVTSFTGWTFFGQLTSVLRNQGVTILGYQFYNASVIAARSIALNVANYVNIFANNFNTGLYPPIIKEYAIGNKPGMFRLIFQGSKITFYLMWIFALPLFLQMDTVLSIWLKNPPPYSIFFTRLALIETIINATSMPLSTAARAPGKMKNYELPLGLIQILIFGVTWYLMRCGLPAYVMFVSACVGSLVMYVFRIVVLRSYIGLLAGEFVRNVLLSVVPVIIASTLPSYFVQRLLPSGLWWSVLHICITVFLTFSCIYFIGFDKEMRVKVKDFCHTRLKKGSLR